MSNNTTERRMLRREQHRSRSLSSNLAVGVAAVGSAYLGTEAALAALGLGPLLFAPEQLVAEINTPGTTALLGVAAIMVLGLVALIVAITPGRLARHVLPHDRLAVVVDDNVLASSLSRAARTAASVSSSGVRTTIGSRTALVVVTPSSGFPVDRDVVRTAAVSVIDRLAPRPIVSLDVAVAPSGVVGS